MPKKPLLQQKIADIYNLSYLNRIGSRDGGYLHLSKQTKRMEELISWVY